MEPLRGDVPIGEAIFPGFGGFSGGGFDRFPLAAEGIGIQPGLEIGRGQVGKMQEQVGQVAFGIDQNGRDALERGFFHQANAQTGFPGTGHAGDNGVRGQVHRVIIERLLDLPGIFQVILAAKIKLIGHGNAPEAGVGSGWEKDG